MTVILPETSLCAIIRDEMMNPAGGIRRFVESHVPHVEEAVIVDTGSEDGTREVLEELELEYPTLSVYDYVFDSYAAARNFSLTKVKTRRVLIIDADELILEQDFPELHDQLQLEQDIWGFNFDLCNITFSGHEKSATWGIHNPRLYTIKSGLAYVDKFEVLLFSNTYLVDTDLNTTTAAVPLYQFLPTEKGLQNKKTEWYGYARDTGVAPSTVEGFDTWKQFNPHRDKYDTVKSELSREYVRKKKRLRRERNKDRICKLLTL